MAGWPPRAPSALCYSRRAREVGAPSMDKDTAEVAGMGPLLDGPSLDPEQKQRLIKRLLELEDQLPTGQLLAGGLTPAQDEAVIPDIIAAFKDVGDSSTAPALLLLLADPATRVAPLVLLVLRHLEPRLFVETLSHP